MELITNQNKCDLCGNTSWQRHSGKLLKCSNCGLIVADLDFNKVQLEVIYSNDYFFGEEYYNYIDDRVALEYNFNKRLKQLNSYLAGRDLLEIGCAYGFFINLARKYCRSVVGYEINMEAIEFARKNFNLDVVNAEYSSADKKYDVICMWDVIEHLSSPSQTIALVSASLNPGGIVALTTGDVGSLVARVRGDKWRLVHPPSHLYYFDRITIIKLLEKHGLRLKYFGHPKIYRNLGSVLKQIIINKEKAGRKLLLLKVIQKIINNIGLGRFNFGINLYDIMEVVAVKK